MITVISHIFNEEFLLPFWLKHHREIFDEGIIIDYDSTDKSLDIVRELAPKWRIVKSVNKLFHAVNCDKEVMEYEQSIEGWKMALNTTEFFLPSDLNFTKIVEPTIYRCNPIFVIDKEGSYDKPWDKSPNQLYDGDLYGYSELEQNNNRVEGLVRSRMVHNLPDGRYHSGRHDSDYGWGGLNLDLLLLYVADYPRSKEMLERKLQIKDKLDKEHQPYPSKDSPKGHYWDKKEIERVHNHQISISRPLVEIDGVENILRKYQSK